MRLSDKSLQALKASKIQREIIGDRPGFRVRVSVARGKTRVMFRYRVMRDGVIRVITMGEYGAGFGLADANALRESCEQAAKAGRDPQQAVDAYWAQRVPAPVPTEPTGPTVKDVVDEFIKHSGRKTQQAKYLLEHNVVTEIGTKPVKALEKRDIIEVLDKIVARGSLTVANRVQQVLKQAFELSLDRDLIPHMPPYPRKLLGGDEAPRTRTLTDPELRQLWKGLDDLSTGDGAILLRPLALALKLQLVTAQRRGEIAKAHWDQITVETEQTDAGPVERQTWAIPTSPKRKKAKEKIIRHIPLSPLALSLLAELKKLADGGDSWFPTARKKPGAKTDASADRDRSISKTAREARKALEMKDWRPHDLRRTARTRMAGLGIAEVVSERVLGHAHEDAMTEVYNQHQYVSEMRVALDAWAVELERILAAKSDGSDHRAKIVSSAAALI